METNIFPLCQEYSHLFPGPDLFLSECNIIWCIFWNYRIVSDYNWCTSSNLQREPPFCALVGISSHPSFNAALTRVCAEDLNCGPTMKTCSVKRSEEHSSWSQIAEGNGTQTHMKNKQGASLYHVGARYRKPTRNRSEDFTVEETTETNQAGTESKASSLLGGHHSARKCYQAAGGRRR